jgi:DNA-binding GntR family transcriptional regulator
MQEMFSPLKRESLPNEIAHFILKKIFLGQLRLGSRITESEIVKELSVSNIPVREAFYILENTGVIERLPRKGVRVKSISNEEIKDCTDALIELCRLGIDYSKEKWEETNKSDLIMYFKDAEFKIREGNIEEYVLKCEKIVSYLFKVAGNRTFQRFHSDITYITNAYCQTRWDNPENIKKCHDYLENFVNKIINSEFEEAKNELELLIRQSLIIA